MHKSKIKYGATVFFVFSYFFTGILSYIPAVSGIKYLGLIIVESFLIVSLNGRIIRLKSITTVFFLYQLFLIFVTLFRGYSVNNCQASIQMCFSLWLVKSIVKENGVKIFFRGAYDVCRIMFPINLIVCILFKNGIIVGDNGVGIYLLGNRNTMGSSTIALIIMCLLYSLLYFGKIIGTVRMVCFLGASSCFITWSATTIIALFVIFVYLIFQHTKQVSWIIKMVNVKSSLFVGIMLFVSINIMRMQTYFSFIIEQVLHKTINFSARTYVWDKALEIIPQHWGVGYGFYSSTILSTNYFTPANTHSFFFEVIVTGGVVGLLFMFLLFKMFSDSLKYMNDPSVKKILNLYFLLIMITGVSEATNLNLCLYLFMVVANEWPDTLSKMRRDLKFVLLK